MKIMENGEYTSEYLAELERIDQLKAERGETKPFEIGQSYLTREGTTVTCIELHGECARFDDGNARYCDILKREVTSGWRYNRNNIDRGRVTGTPFDHSDPRCVIPESLK